MLRIDIGALDTAAINALTRESAKAYLPGEPVQLVAGAAAVAVESVRGEDRLVAFIETPKAPVTQEEIKAFVRERLADYKVPRSVHVVRAFPMNPGGKPDKRKLFAELVDKG